MHRPNKSCTNGSNGSNGRQNGHNNFVKKRKRRMLQGQGFGVVLCLAMVCYTLNMVSTRVPNSTISFLPTNTKRDKEVLEHKKNRTEDPTSSRRDALQKKIKAARENGRLPGSHLPEAPSDAKDAVPTTSVEDVAAIAVQHRAMSSTLEFVVPADTVVPPLIDGPNSTSWEQALILKRRAEESLRNPVPVIPKAPLQLLRLHQMKPNANANNFNGTAANKGSAALLKYNSTKPIMAIITSTRSTPNQTETVDSLLVKHLLKSIIETVTPTEREHWDVHLYVAVDDTDTWWLDHWHHVVTAPWLKVTFGVFPDGGQHIPFNEIALVAYSEGADYLCRVNDDSQLKTREWITMAVAVMQQYDPPNIGVVAPKCGTL